MAKEAAELNLTSSFDLFTKSYEKIKKNIGIVLGLYFGPILIFFLLIMTAVGIPAVITSASGSSNAANIIAIISGTLVFVGIILFFLIYTAVIQTLYLQLARDKKPTLNSVWQEARPRVVDVFFATILSGLVILGGFLLFIIPGFFMIRRYYLVSYFVIDKKLGAREAMKQCSAKSIKASGYVWGVLGVTLLLSLAGFIPFIGGLISMVLGIIYSVAPALRYDEIKDLA